MRRWRYGVFHLLCFHLLFHLLCFTWLCFTCCVLNHVPDAGVLCFVFLFVSIKIVVRRNLHKHTKCVVEPIENQRKVVPDVGHHESVDGIAPILRPPPTCVAATPLVGCQSYVQRPNVVANVVVEIVEEIHG